MYLKRRLGPQPQQWSFSSKRRFGRPCLSTWCRSQNLPVPVVALSRDFDFGSVHFLNVSSILRTRLPCSIILFLIHLFFFVLQLDALGWAWEILRKTGNKNCSSFCFFGFPFQTRNSHTHTEKHMEKGTCCRVLTTRQDKTRDEILWMLFLCQRSSQYLVSVTVGVLVKVWTSDLTIAGTRFRVHLIRISVSEAVGACFIVGHLVLSLLKFGNGNWELTRSRLKNKKRKYTF